jgi:N-acetylglucosaminylphosphatidylinositol deacetylase
LRLCDVSSSTHAENARTKTNVLLLVAHPDDESMFFGPTLLSLSKLGGYSIRVICLSTGNADGFGARRKLEMVAACSVLKVNNNSLPFPVLVDSLGFRF